MNLVPKRFGKGIQVAKTRQRRSIPIYVPKKGSSLLNYDVLNKQNYGIPPIHVLWEINLVLGLKKHDQKREKDC